MALQADQIQDLITVTLKDLGRLKFVELASKTSRVPLLRSLIDQYRSGISPAAIQWNIAKTNPVLPRTLASSKAITSTFLTL